MKSTYNDNRRFSSASTLAEPTLDFEGTVTEQRWKRHFLDLLSLSAQKPVSEKLFQAWCSINQPLWTQIFHRSGVWDTAKFGDALDEFQAASLGTMSGTWHGFGFELDGGVRDFFMAELAESRTAYVVEFSTILATFLEHKDAFAMTEESFIIEHIDSCLASYHCLSDENSHHAVSAVSFYHFALAYQDAGRYQDAQTMFEAALYRQSSETGMQNPRYSHVAECLGLLLMLRGTFEEARGVLERNVQLRKKLYGSRHPQTLESMENLANCYRNEGKHLQAEDQFMRLLFITKKPWSTLKNNLPILRCEQGRWTEAEEIFKDLIEERTSQLGPQHPDTLAAMHNLAALYADQFKNDDAERWIEKVLREKTARLGVDHPEVFPVIKVLTTPSCRRAIPRKHSTCWQGH